MAADRILLVDDDEEIRELIQILLESEGYQVQQAADGETALTMLDESIDLIILDVMMPGQSGYLVCKKIRTFSQVPILFLTAKAQDSDLIMGFSCGGDDYLQKPFSNGELIARVKGLLRRYHVYKGKDDAADADEITCGVLRISKRFNEAYKGERELQLTETEYQLLLLMMRYPGKIFSAANLYESVWNEPYLSTSANTIMVHMRRLRAKVEDDPQNPVHIKTVWGKGYRVEK